MKIRTITIYCIKCKIPLYCYRKKGTGTLIKCYVDMVKKDYTNGDLKCPKCNQQFARHAIIHNKPAYKIIQGKVFVRS